VASGTRREGAEPDAGEGTHGTRAEVTRGTDGGHTPPRLLPHAGGGRGGVDHESDATTAGNPPTL
jgi:hypothetical protein